MAELGTAYVDIKGDYDKFGKETQSAFGGIAKRAAGIFAAAFVGAKIIDFGAASVEAASDLGESLNAVTQTFGPFTDEINKLGEASAQNVGLAQSEFNALAVSTAGFANVISGELGTEVPQVVDDMTTRIADFASVMNLDVNVAGEEFRSIMAGSSEVARKYGLDLSAATVEQFALEQGLAASAAEMTEADKTAARYGLLMQSTEQWAGDFADTSDDLANSTRIAQAEFKNAQAELGQALLPILAEVMGMVRDQFIPIINQLQPVFVLIADAIAQLLPPVASLIERLAPLVAKILPPLTKVLLVIIDLFVALLDPIITLIDAALTPILPIIEMLATEFGEALMPAIQAVAQVVQALIPLIELVAPIIQIQAEVAGMLAQVLGQLLAGAIEVVADLLSRLIDWIRPAIEWITDLASNIKDSLAANLEGVADWFRELPGMIMDFIGNAAEWLIDTGKDVITGFIDGVKSMAGNVVTAIKDFVLDKIPGFVKDFFGIASPSKMFMEFGAALPQGMAAGIMGGRREVANAMGSLLQSPRLPGFGLLGADAELAGAGVHLTFNGPVGGDMGLFARQIAQESARELRYQRG